MPRCDVAASFDILIAAPRERVWQELLRSDFSRSRVIQFLGRIRSLGRRHQPEPSSPTLKKMEAGGFLELARLQDQEIVIGVIGRFWRPDSGVLRQWKPEEFTSLTPEGSAKAAWNFSLTEAGESTRLRTETRVQCFGTAARTKFLLYWLAIGWFSGWIRREVLHLIKTQSESEPASNQTPTSTTETLRQNQ